MFACDETVSLTIKFKVSSFFPHVDGAPFPLAVSAMWRGGRAKAESHWHSTVQYSRSFWGGHSGISLNCDRVCRSCILGFVTLHVVVPASVEETGGAYPHDGLTTKFISSEYWMVYKCWIFRAWNAEKHVGAFNDRFSHITRWEMCEVPTVFDWNWRHSVNLTTFQFVFCTKFEDSALENQHASDI